MLLVGRSAALDEVRKLATRAGRTLASVLITGETGSGKELVARRIHAAGATAHGPFVPVNCAALPPDLVESLLFGHEKGSFTGAARKSPGKFLEADGGTIFLDEVGELPAAAQAKLLRVLQERVVEPVGGRPAPVKLRVVAATHRDLAAEAEAGRFREDLLYRLAVVRIAVPPLRARLEDLADLVPHLVARIAARLGIAAPPVDPGLVDALKGYSWPGNVRQLENLLEEAMVLAEDGAPLSPACLPRHFRRDALLEGFDAAPVPAATLATPVGPVLDPSPAGLGAGGPGLSERLDRYAKSLVLEALQRTGGKKAEAARLLGLSPRALTHYLRKFGIP